MTTPSYPADWKPHPGPVPILEYHAIQPPVPGRSFRSCSCPQADFQRQMQWLKDNGYEAVTLDQVETAWYEHGELPPKPIVVSFDDGYLSQYVAAFPELQHLGWKGVINLIAQGSDLPDADVQKMIDAGWELASHTITHADLTTLDSAQLEARGRGLAPDPQAALRRPGEQLLLSGGLLRRHGDLRGSQRPATWARSPRCRGWRARPIRTSSTGSRSSSSDGLQGFIEKLRAAGAA